MAQFSLQTGNQLRYALIYVGLRDILGAGKAKYKARLSGHVISNQKCEARVSKVKEAEVDIQMR
jgi:hypothetical protein